MPWGKSSAKCTPLINGLEICDRVKPWHKNLNASTMSLSDVLSVNSDGAHFGNSFCVTVNNRDALGFLAYARTPMDHSIQDAVKSEPLPSTVVCVNKNKANDYLRAFEDPQDFSKLVEFFGECSVSKVRQVVEDASTLKSQNPTIPEEEIRQQLDAPDGCNEDIVKRVIQDVVRHGS